MKKTIVWHPVLICLYYVSAFASVNLAELSCHDAIRPLIVLLIFALVLGGLWYWLLGDGHRAGIMTSVCLFPLLSHRQIYRWLIFLLLQHRQFVVEHELTRTQVHQWVLGGSVVAALSVALLLMRTRGSLWRVTRFLNLLVAIWLAWPVYMIATRFPRSDVGVLPPIALVPAAGTTRRPLSNVYYIILDAYGRSDVLQELYGYDNRPFLQALTQRGFYVAMESHSNYANTHPSLASSLNLTYLDSVAAHVGANSSNHQPLIRLIHENRLAAFFKALGYTVVDFSSGNVATEVFPADRRLSSPGFLSDFEQVFLTLTSIPHAIDLMNRWLGSYRIPDQLDAHRARILYILNHLADAASVDRPTFVFAHIVSPHLPFAFREDGSRAELGLQGFSFTNGVYAQGYSQQIAFLNTQVIAAIDRVLQKERTPPIIIIQGDHGPPSRFNWQQPERSNMRELLSILNAYHLPDGGQAYLYPGITPVNTFRVVLSHYFEQELLLLEDRSFFSTYWYPYRLIDVTGQLASSVDHDRPARSDPVGQHAMPAVEVR